MRLLAELRGGNRNALGELFTLVYDELHAQAHAQRHLWQGDYTLNTTALVHEAYLKLVDQKQVTWHDRTHFLAVAGRAMRHILFDYAKHRRREKRGGGLQRVSLDEIDPARERSLVLSEERAELFVALEEALSRLEQVNPRQGQIVECRFFGQMTIEETAEALGVSPATVKRGWELARAWLYREIRRTLNV